MSREHPTLPSDRTERRGRCGLGEPESPTSHRCLCLYVPTSLPPSLRLYICVRVSRVFSFSDSYCVSVSDPSLPCLLHGFLFSCTTTSRSLCPFLSRSSLFPAICARHSLPPHPTPVPLRRSSGLSVVPSRGLSRLSTLSVPHSRILLHFLLRSSVSFLLDTRLSGYTSSDSVRCVL